MQIVDGAAVVPGVDDRHRRAGEPGKMLCAAGLLQRLVVLEAGPERHRVRDLPAPDVVHHGGINTAVHRQEEVFRLKEGGDQMNGFVVDEKRPETVRLGDAAHGLAGLDGLDNGPITLACRRAPHPPRLEPPAALCRRGMVHGATAGPGPRRDRPSGPIDLSCRERDRKSLVALARDPFHPVCPGVQVGRLVLRVRPKSDAIE